MATWSEPPDWGSNVLTSAQMDQYVSENLRYLKGVADGVGFSAVKVTRDGGGSQSITDATDTDVTFTAESFDFGGYWSSGTTVTVPAGAIPAGFTTVAIMLIGIVRFVSNATGGRKIIFLKDGVEVDSYSTPAINGDATTVQLTSFTTAAAAAAFKMQVRQNSGGALNMDVARLTVVRFLPAS